MTYLDYLNAFNMWLESNALAASSQLLYFKLLNVFNRAGWPEFVQVDNRRLMSIIGTETEKTAIRARDALIEAGLMTYQKGRKGSPNRYFLSKIYCKNYSVCDRENDSVCDRENDSVCDRENDSVCDRENDRENDSHIKTKKKTKTKNITPPIIPPKGEKDVFSSYAGEDLELLSALRDFESMRKKIKKPMSDRSKEMLLKRLDELADTGSRKVDLLNNAIYHCWQSVYPREGGNYGTDASTGHQGDGGKGPQYGTVL